MMVMELLNNAGIGPLIAVFVVVALMLNAAFRHVVWNIAVFGGACVFLVYAVKVFAP